MTVKSPFYNKPSTLTSVDSCHKCPSQPSTTQLSANFRKTSGLLFLPEKDQSKTVSTVNTGVDQSMVFVPSTNNNKIHTASSVIVEPCNSSVAKMDIGSTVATSCSNCGITSTPLWRRSPLGEIICNACGLYYKARNTSRPVWLKKNTTALTKRSFKTCPIAPRIIRSPPLLAPAPSNTAKDPILLLAIKTNRNQEKDTQMPPQQQHFTEPIKNSFDSTVSSTPDSTTTTDTTLSCINCHTSTTPLWRRDEFGQPICNACGLYFKLHSIHRPITMKRSTIKRRKRVTAATIATQRRHPVIIQQYPHLKSYPIKQQQQPNRNNETNSSLSKSTLHPTDPQLRPLLPLLSPSYIRSTKDNIPSYPGVPGPDPIEPDVSQQHFRYLPSPPMKPTKTRNNNNTNIACLLNPDIKKHERNLPGLPSPPMLTHDDTGPSPPPTADLDSPLLSHPISKDPKHTHKVLKAHRNELKREFNNLTFLLTRTTTMLQNIDHAMAVNTLSISAAASHKDEY
ncbi:hypothetical protein BDF20DRAFT_848107 [Mycotypha africana]|uniref:uncharacterized protein n=1 Tax=Mycotypha africana TaxID=64632 RepID=UPI0023013495|nr:uncharacterized protein BDF20DRAFT_848107 [Mycotypha africana]KAI8992077.1 hypothetical protein BDF20DRAFT_848107 [Mycotypha africana]